MAAKCHLDYCVLCAPCGRCEGEVPWGGGACKGVEILCMLFTWYQLFFICPVSRPPRSSPLVSAVWLFRPGHSPDTDEWLLQ